MEKAKQILLVVLAAIVTGMIGYLVGRYHFREVAKIAQIDTLVVYDTVRVEKPAEIRYVKTTQKIKIPVHDTIVVHDTTYMLLDKEMKEYRDSMYYARVSGYDPSLDYIEVYPKTTTITKAIVQPPSPWGYSLNIGVDYRKLGRHYLLPNIGAGISYKKVAIGVECGVQIHVPDGETLPPQLYWGLGIKYRLAGN